MRRDSGFTLIELAIVVTIIGLIVGGILVGQHLVRSAEVRAQISQIEKYNVEANTFYGKYQALPGDAPQPVVNQFGFMARAGTAGRGDGDGILEGYDYNGTQAAYICSAANQCYISGEPSFFWEDLSSAGMIEGSFTRAMDAPDTVFCPNCPGRDLTQVFPKAKVGSNGFVFTYGGSGQNFFGVVNIYTFNQVIQTGTANFPVSEAYAIDAKVDDGLPQTGRVTARIYANTNWWIGGWVAGGNGGGAYWLAQGATPNTATPQTSTTCYDNGGVAFGTMQYSLGSVANYGTGINCALSFQMQAR